jgi:hypothetical protein
MMNSRGLLALFGAFLLFFNHPSASPAGDGKGQLAEKARAVLRKHCLECHGSGKEVRGELRLLDYKLLRQRRVVVPSDPDDSELLQLVQCGTMPPGTRPKLPSADVATLRDWIVAGAPDFPPELGDAYVLQKIADDVRSASDNPSVARWRYLSFNHLLSSQVDLKEQQNPLAKTKLEGALSRLSGRPAHLVSIEPTQTIFRVDLRDLGWDARPFVEREAGVDGEPSRTNLFDLLLLEYPFAVVPERSEPFRELVANYLKRAVPVRAIPFVRADWFIDQTARLPLAADLSGGRGSKTDGLIPKPSETEEFFKNVAAVANQRKQDREAASPGLPILPLDGLTHPNYEPAELPFQVTLRTKDERGREKTVFRPGDQLVVVVANKGERKIYFELIGTSIDGKKMLLQKRPVLELEPRKEFRFPAEGSLPIKGDSLGKDQFTIYASDVSFPAGVFLRDKNKKIADRFVHPFYEVPRQGNEVRPGFEPNRFLKRTVEIETRNP